MGPAQGHGEEEDPRVRLGAPAVGFGERRSSVSAVAAGLVGGNVGSGGRGEASGERKAEQG